MIKRLRPAAPSSNCHKVIPTEVHIHSQHQPVTRCSHGNSVRTALLSVIDSLLVEIFYSLHGTSAYGGLCTRSYSLHCITLQSSHCTAMPFARLSVTPVSTGAALVSLQEASGLPLVRWQSLDVHVAWHHSARSPWSSLAARPAISFHAGTGTFLPCITTKAARCDCSGGTLESLHEQDVCQPK